MYTLYVAVVLLPCTIKLQSIMTDYIHVVAHQIMYMYMYTVHVRIQMYMYTYYVILYMCAQLPV